MSKDKTCKTCKNKKNTYDGNYCLLGNRLCVDERNDPTSCGKYFKGWIKQAPNVLTTLLGE